jgi:hypothetical protein
VLETIYEGKMDGWMGAPLFFFFSRRKGLRNQPTIPFIGFMHLQVDAWLFAEGWNFFFFFSFL